jgi:hypothetical protein
MYINIYMIIKGMEAKGLKRAKGAPIIIKLKLPPQVSIDDIIPPEIIEYILSFLTDIELRKCNTVCRAWYQFYTNLTGKFSDVAFICDATHSMQKKWLLMNRFFSTLKPNGRTRYSFILFSDHETKARYKGHDITDVTSVSDLSYYKFTSVVDGLRDIELKAGLDDPEAILDALFTLAELKWRPLSTKRAILLTDAVPHGDKYGGKKDNWPNGCPCGLTETDVFAYLKDHNIKLSVIYFDTICETMCSTFKQFYDVSCNYFARSPDEIINNTKFKELIQKELNR